MQRKLFFAFFVLFFNINTLIEMHVSSVLHNLGTICMLQVATLMLVQLHSEMSSQGTLSTSL